MSVIVKVVAKADLEITCDGCRRIESFKQRAEGSLIYGIDKMVRHQARRDSESQGWVYKNEGSKGYKHYCPECMRKPELATWHMQKILTRP